MTPQELETLHAYQRNQLSATERLNLEEKLRQDPHWQQLWSSFQVLTSGIEATGQGQIRQAIEAASRRNRLRQDKKRRTQRWALGIAATLALLLVVGAGILNQQQQQILQLERTYYHDDQKFLKQMLDALEMPGFARQHTADSLLLMGLLALENREWARAIAFLTRTINHQPDAVGQFFLGKAYLGQQDYQLALQTWRTLPVDAPAWVKQATRYELSWLYAKRFWTQSQAKKMWRAIAKDTTDAQQESMRRMLQKMGK